MSKKLTKKLTKKQAYKKFLKPKRKRINGTWHYWVKSHRRNGKNIKGHWNKFPWEL